MATADPPCPRRTKARLCRASGLTVSVGVCVTCSRQWAAGKPPKEPTTPILVGLTLRGTVPAPQPTVPADPPAPERGECVHIGKRLRQLPGCGTCQVYQCDVHGECTRRTRVADVQGCDRCPDWTPEKETAAPS
jgi:hypothetical protein